MTSLLPAVMPRYPAAATGPAAITFGPEKSAVPAMFATSPNSVRVGPGQRHVTVTPVPSNSFATASENDNTYAFVA
jgi:hypothetical protein